MKKITIIIAMFFAVASIKAQTFMRIPVNYVKIDHITLNAGTGLTFNTPLFKRGGLIEPTSTEKAPGLFFQLNTYSSHDDISDVVKYGIEMNYQYFKNQWDATFSSTVMSDPNYNYHYMGKYSEIGLGMGSVFTFSFSDNFDLVASVGLDMGFLLYGENKAEAVRVKNGEVYPEPSLNNWHKASADDNFSFEVGVYGKLGGYYSLADWFSIGLLGMYHLPLQGTAVVDEGSIPNAQDMGYNMTGYVGKLQFGTVMLSLRFDID